MGAATETKNEWLRPERVFLFFGLLFGLAMVFLTPPFQAADEMTHFLRAYQISEGQIFSEKEKGQVGGWLPSSLAVPWAKYGNLPGKLDEKVKVSREEFGTLLKQKLDPGARMFWGFPNTSSYTPLIYIGQSTAIGIGRLAKLSPLILMYLSRIFNLAVWIALTYWAIRLAPIARWGMLLLALTPMALFQGASSSGDAAVNGISFLWVGLCLHARSDRVQRLRGSLYWALGGVAACLVLSKQAYFPLLLLLLIVPRAKFGGRSRQLGSVAFFSLTAMGLLALWMALNASNVAPMHAQVNIEEQARFLLSHPGQFAKILFTTYVSNGLNHLHSLVGILGWLDVILPWSLLTPVIITILLVGILESNPSFNLDWTSRVWICLAMTLVWLVISIAIFITWTSPGTGWIEGIQGRYFIPILPLTLLLIYRQRISPGWNRLALQLLSLNSLAISLPWTLIAIHSRYY